MTLRCTIPRLEAALALEPSAFACPRAGRCPHAGPGCVIFAPGWWCEEVEEVVLPALLRDPDDEDNGDAEPDDDYR